MNASQHCGSLFNLTKQNTLAKKDSEETAHKNSVVKRREPLRFLFIYAFLSVRIFEFSQDFECYPINGTRDGKVEFWQTIFILFLSLSLYLQYNVI